VPEGIVGRSVVPARPVDRLRIRAAERLYGWRQDGLLGRDIVEVTPTEQTADDAEALMDASAGGETWTGRFGSRYRRVAGRPRLRPCSFGNPPGSGCKRGGACPRDCSDERWNQEPDVEPDRLVAFTALGAAVPKDRAVGNTASPS
jgi:PAS domain-containing protein